MKTPLRRVAALATVALTTGALALGTVAPAGAVTAQKRETKAAQWLAKQPAENGLVEVFYDYDGSTYSYSDYGVSIDVATALLELGAGADTVDAVAQAVSEGVRGYTYADGEVLGYASATAKAAAFLQDAGLSPANAQDDLIVNLKAMLSTDDGIVGRVQDDTGYADTANVFGQAFAAQALAEDGSRKKAAAATRFLLRQQCDEGYFRLNFNDASAKRQGCKSGAGDSGADTDSTAQAVLSLTAIASSGSPVLVRKVDAALADALSWLRSGQKRNGSYGGGSSTESSNTDSTGLAARALTALGACTRAQDAAQWITRSQVLGARSGDALAGQNGAIAYDPKTRRTGESDGISDTGAYQWQKATADAAPALASLTIAGC
ncbi:hypothetical protein [Nocardioides bruguierae]|uniref:Peptidase n=1 Tax=Nocardioides bruguierae TaxID=2945102 RepID=A0A9X2D5C8_9ACTN|nr:hypothetical protein [Nocardioides bruguierae]MCM0619752.1 hypothetical protein [Nocardioides bruguierae]